MLRWTQLITSQRRGSLFPVKLRIGRLLLIVRIQPVWGLQIISSNLFHLNVSLVQCCPAHLPPATCGEYAVQMWRMSLFQDTLKMTYFGLNQWPRICICQRWDEPKDALQKCGKWQASFSTIVAKAKHCWTTLILSVPFSYLFLKQSVLNVIVVRYLHKANFINILPAAFAPIFLGQKIKDKL